MSTFKCRYTVPMDLTVTVKAADEDAAEEASWDLAQEYLQTIFGDRRGVYAHADLDGIGADGIEEETEMTTTYEAIVTVYIHRPDGTFTRITDGVELSPGECSGAEARETYQVNRAIDQAKATVLSRIGSDDGDPDDPGLVRL